jgi:hypothetical protein
MVTSYLHRQTGDLLMQIRCDHPYFLIHCHVRRSCKFQDALVIFICIVYSSYLKLCQYVTSSKKHSVQTSLIYRSFCSEPYFLKLHEQTSGFDINFHHGCSDVWSIIFITKSSVIFPVLYSIFCTVFLLYS